MTLELLSADLLRPVRHAFFTRKGGASSGIFSGLNCGPGSSDQRECVEINRQRAVAAMDLPIEALAVVKQVHSDRVVAVERAFDGALPEADGMVTVVPGLALAVLTADCQPVLFADKEAGVIAAVHAGWKGALAGVLEAALVAMERLGARRERTLAAIGPTISQRAYEVGPEFLDRFMAEDDDAPRFFAQGQGDRYLFDLPGYSLDRLRRAGIGAVDWVGHCTYSDPDRFYSYRRSVHLREADYGRLISMIRL